MAKARSDGMRTETKDRAARGSPLAFAATLGAALGLAGCQTAPRSPAERMPARRTDPTRLEADRGFAQATPALSATPYGQLLKNLKLKNYGANLHAHHFMEVRGTRNNPLTLEQALAEGPCRASGTFTMDDGRPCRDENGAENATIPPRKNADGSLDLADYFRQACAYGTGPGELDVLFVTPHTKNNGEREGALNTSTLRDEMVKRAGMLAELNPKQGRRPEHYCGMGQEASSISAGNHINVFGQFTAAGRDPAPLYFPAGDFPTLYGEIKRRNAAGAKIFLQLNHPGVKADLWWRDMAQFADSKSRKKEGMNDYGLDDYAPAGCMIGKLSGEACAGVTETLLTNDLLRRTYANIRRAADDPFRLIEIVSPGGKKEGGEDAEGDGADDGRKKSFGATNNSMTTFPSVQDREDADSYEEGVYDWIYYLAMGFKLAPTANQDNHHMNFGSATASRTGIVAKDLNERSILDALRARRTFASEDRNAGILLALDPSPRGGSTRKTMGDVVKTSAARGQFRVGYYDPDAGDEAAKVRVYYYRASDALDFAYGAPMKKVFRTVGFDARERAVIPAADAEARSANDLIPIQNGQTIEIDLPLARGEQWVFVEVVQDGDLDKLWSAPIWVTRK